MVRRWSYINSLNSFNHADCYVAHKSAFDTIINTTMYLGKTFTLVTALRRRKWARRKHIHSWIPLMNILHNWASMYRFYKNYLKTTLNQFFFKNSFLALNLLRAKNSLPCLYKGSELVVTSSVTKRSLTYFSSYLNPRLRFLINQLGSQTLLVSIPYVTEAEEGLPAQANSLVPSLSDNLDSWSHYSTNTFDEKTKEKLVLLSLLKNTEKSFLSLAITLYKTLILLLLRHL